MGDSPDLLDLLNGALSVHGRRARRIGRFIRLPAVWRGGDDDNVSVSPTGFWIDFATGDKGRLHELLRLLGAEGDGPLPLSAPSGGADQRERERREKIALANRIWDQSPDLGAARLAGVPVRRYLYGRGIPEPIIRFIGPFIRARREKDGLFVLLLPIYAPAPPWPLIRLQRIFLDPDGRKAGRIPKKMLGLHFWHGQSGGVLIPAVPGRHPPEGIALLVCEGFETGLALYAMSGYPVYVAYDAGGLEQVSCDYLHRLRPARVVIAADNDDPDREGRRRGQAAAAHLQTRLTAAGLAAAIALPPRELGGPKGADWLDVWQQAGKNANDVLHRAAGLPLPQPPP